MEIYTLLKDFNWFGKTIPSGTIYKQYQTSKDKFRCFSAEGNECPHWDLTFMSVMNNPKYFMKLNNRALSASF